MYWGGVRWHDDPHRECSWREDGCQTHSSNSWSFWREVWKHFQNTCRGRKNACTLSAVPLYVICILVTFILHIDIAPSVRNKIIIIWSMLLRSSSEMSGLQTTMGTCPVFLPECWTSFQLHSIISMLRADDCIVSWWSTYKIYPYTRTLWKVLLPMWTTLSVTLAMSNLAPGVTSLSSRRWWRRPSPKEAWVEGGW